MGTISKLNKTEKEEHIDMTNIKSHIRSLESQPAAEVSISAVLDQIKSQNILVKTKMIPCICIENNVEPEKVIEHINQKWKRKNPKLVISVTGGVNNFFLHHDVKDLFKESLIRAAKSTGAWITTGGADYGVMRLVGDAVSEGLLTYDLTILGIAIKCKVTNGIPNQENQLVNNQDTKLNPYHSHFILVYHGDNAEWGQEIKFRSLLEEKLIESDGHMVLIVVGGGKCAFENINETLQKNHPILLVKVSDTAKRELRFFTLFSTYNFYGQESGGCADAMIKILSDSCKTEKDIENILKELILTEEEKNQSLEYSKAIKQKWTENPDLIHVFSIKTTDDIEKATFTALTKKFNKILELKEKNLNLLEYLKLAFQWNNVEYFGTILNRLENQTSDHISSEISMLFYRAIVENKPKFVEIMLDNLNDLKEVFEDVGLIQIYTTLWDNYKKLPFVYVLGDYNPLRKDSETTIICDHVSRRLQGLMGENIKIGKHLLDKDKYLIQNLFLVSLLFTRLEIAFIFWKKGENQIINALFAVNFLTKLSIKYTGDKEELMNYSKKFEEAAIGTMNVVDDQTHYFVNYCAFFRTVSYFETNVLEMAIASKNMEFVAHPALQNIFNDIWYGVTKHVHIFDYQYILSIITFGATAPVFYKKENILRFERNIEEREETLIKSQNLENICSKKILRHLNKLQESQKDQNNQNKKKESLVNEFCPRYSWFMTTPVVQYTYGLFYFVIFLYLFSRFLISKFPITTNNVSGDTWISFTVLNIMSISLFIEEINQLLDPVKMNKKMTEPQYTSRLTLIRRLFKYYYTDRWNIVDNIGLLLFFLADILFVFSFINFEHHTSDKILQFSKFLYLVDLILWFVKGLHFCALDPYLGPLLKIFERIVIEDMRFFIIIIGIISLAFGIVSHASLMKFQSKGLQNTEDINSSFVNKTSPRHMLNPYTKEDEPVIRKIIHYAYWPIFGDLKIYDEFECENKDCPNLSSWWHKFVFFLLMLYALAILVLINLLIAMFNSTYEKLNVETDRIWKYLRFFLIFSYLNYSSAPPPFNLVHRAVLLLSKRYSEKKTGESNINANIYSPDSYVEFERSCAYEYLRKLKKKENSQDSSSDKNDQ